MKKETNLQLEVKRVRKVDLDKIGGGVGPCPALSGCAVSCRRGTDPQ